MSTLGPISTALEAELRQRVQQNGIVIWLDRDGHYSPLVDQLQALRAEGALPYAVHGFRGSHLALMLDLDAVAAGSDPPRLLIHLPGFTEDTVTQTPVLGLYRSGTRFRKALGTLIREAAAGQVPGEAIEAFVATEPDTLAMADAWLQAQLQADGGGLYEQVRSTPVVEVVEQLLSDGPLCRQLTSADARDQFLRAMEATLGLPRNWHRPAPQEIAESSDSGDLGDAISNAVMSALAQANVSQAMWESGRPATRQQRDDLAFILTSWALVVEYVHDLKRAPKGAAAEAAKTVPARLVSTCRELASHLRARHTAIYQRTADEAELLLSEERQLARAEDLGRIDTFRFEESTVLEAALDALQQRQFRNAAQWAAQRLSSDGKQQSDSFWLQQDPARHETWQLISAAARLGEAIHHAGDLSRNLPSLQQAVDRYVERGAAVDQAHRLLEQRRLTALAPQIPAFERLLVELDGLRQLWRQWADGWAVAFNALCKEHGFLPEAGLQQRQLFHEEVEPLLRQAQNRESQRCAVFLVDALRYEMAIELFQQLQDTPASTVQLKARLAELPTVTEVGMNVLAPVVSQGRLSPSLSSSDGGSIQGFRAGEFLVNNPDTRLRAMQARTAGGPCLKLSLEEVTSLKADTLKKKVDQARLLMVHSREIDSAGEKGVGLDVFDRVLQSLRAAWQRLRTAGVRNFVITSDHGFLLNEGAPPAVRRHGNKNTPSRRHVFRPHAANHDGEVRVALADLGYQGVEGQLMMPEDTAVFDTGKHDMRFVHGGNSLQERLIPVLTLQHRVATGGSSQQFQIEAQQRQGVAGLHCLEIQVKTVEQLALAFGSRNRIELSLKCPDDPDLQVELAQARGAAQLNGSVIQAPVGEAFELFFRLSGSSQEKVRVEVFHPSGTDQVAPCIPECRFLVTALSTAPQRPSEVATPAPQPAPATSPDSPIPQWLQDLSEDGKIRQLFAHLADHGAITEPEVAAMLGSPRAARRFALQVDALASRAPFSVRIVVVGEVKRYVKEQS
ncbi:BREX-6 system phosphatase PglZ [Synechococcus sp. CCAP 1479/9]|uniref:BREX-6 system phosphatase PglZ n=1 Tax=Synechococcus sp. CCAP 1479/9 TaxID=1221593 RepID=UPI001C24DBC2|nr:BREX-6 system phosphatase PglZ [Synechococcus sp. CCAP 1479/9]